MKASNRSHWQHNDNVGFHLKNAATLSNQWGPLLSVPRSTWLVAFSALIAVIFGTDPVCAESSYYESEPNDTPAEANPVAGAITIIGDLGGQEQDAFMWSVSDVDAQKRWTFELKGIPGTPTITEVNRIEFAENGVDVTAKHKLFLIGSRDGARPGLVEDLLFEPGDYLIGVASAGSINGSYRVIIRHGAKLVVSGRSPANPGQESAYKLNTGADYAAFIETPESWYQFKIKEGQSDQLWIAKAQLPMGKKAQLKVQDSHGKLLSATATDVQGRIISKDLDLLAGTYFLQISTETEGSIQAVTVMPLGPRIEAEQANTPAVSKDVTVKRGSWELASRVDLGQPVTGQFGDTRENHYFSFELDETSTEQVLSLRMETENDRTVIFCLLDHSGARIQCRTADGTVELPDLVLAPGSWGLMAESRAAAPAAYAITLNSTAPLQANIEIEPNDAAPQATGIPVGQQIRGRFASREEDFFRIVVTGDAQLWRIEAEGDGIYELRYHDGAGVQIQKAGPDDGQRLVSLQNVFMLPGQHFVSLKGDKGGSYSLTVRALGAPDPNGEHEPNDDNSRAEALEFGQDRHGLLENGDDLDYYRFSLMDDEYLRLTLVPPAGGNIRIYLDYGTTKFASLLTTDSRAGVVQGMFSPGEYQIRLRPYPPATAPYHIKLERLARFGCVNNCEPVHTRELQFPNESNPAVEPTELPVTIALETGVRVVAAYQPYGQRIATTMSLKNESAADKTLALELAVSDYRWTIEQAPASIGLDAGQSRDIPLQVLVPRDAWAGQPVLISARVFDDTGAQTETSISIDVDGSAPSIGPYQSWDLPDSMLGGPNAARAALGGHRVATPGETEAGVLAGVGKYFDQLFDGRVRQGIGMYIEQSRKAEPVVVTVALAGNAAVEVTGIILNPVGRTSPGTYLADFELQLSLDGEQFETVLSDRLRPIAFDQAYALAEPVSARFARLQLLNSHEGESNSAIGLGEWKVVARAGTDLSAGKGLNLASPELGGHVVWSRPATWGNWDGGLLTGVNDNMPFRLKQGQVQEWAISFQHQRAARITRIEWVDPERASPEQRITRVSLSVATDSPVGPWIPIGEWDGPGSSGEFVLDSPVWARYVRFQATGMEKDSTFYAPDTIRIFEQATDETYSSMLGEWGEISPQAAYEKHLGMPIDANLLPASGNNSRDQAEALEFDQQVKGRVMLGEEEDWYKLTVPAGSNTVYLSLSGAPMLRTLLRMEDETGRPLRLIESGSSQSSKKIKAVVEPGASYWIRIEEPPRSVVFAFDNSGSVRPFATAIYRALNSYAGDLVPGRDEARILPFGGEFLTRDWVGEPYIQRVVLNDYARDDISSAAEATLKQATSSLAVKPGVKAVVIVTDAATPREKKLWGSLEKVQPRVFTMRVGNVDDTGLYEDLMQSWSMVNDGFYSYMSSQAEMDRAFDRAATMLRQPAGYGLKATAVFEKAPGPGRLKLVSGDNKGLGGAVELILDASGSMLKRMEGGRRIEIAKKLLSKAVTEHIPAGTPVALRVFGHKEANSCRTDLVIPMQALDPAAVEKTLAGISAMNLAKTPIADSLAMIESDLKDTIGSRLVILVTDGEETCDGDPAEVLAELSEKGIDLRLEIVGFAIDDDTLKQQFEAWAEQGGGRYFDAGDAASLEHSLVEALQVPYSVFDQSGTRVAQGTVDGEALELEAGFYKISLATSPPRIIEELEIPGEKEVIVPID